MLDYADRAIEDPSEPLPVLIPLGGYDGQSDVLAYIHRQLAEAVVEDDSGQLVSLPAHRRLASRLEEEFSDHHLAVFLDGLNEIPSDRLKTGVQRLKAFHRGHPKNRLLITCREADYTGELELPEIHVEPLDDDGKCRLVQAYLDPDQSAALLHHLQDHNQSVWEMARNPYLLRMVVAIYGDRGNLPTNRAELFNEFVGALLRRERFTHPDRWRILVNSPPPRWVGDLMLTLTTRWPSLGKWQATPSLYGLADLSVSERQDAVMQAGLVVLSLAQLAYKMNLSGQRGTTVSADFAMQNLSLNLTAGSFRVEVDIGGMLYLARSANLFEQTVNGYHFTHQLLQDFFAAVYLAGTQNWERESGLFDRSTRWREALVFLSGLLRDPTRLLERSLSDCVTNEQVFRAARCVTEGNEVQESACAPLVSLLKQIAMDGRTEAALEEEISEFYEKRKRSSEEWQEDDAYGADEDDGAAYDDYSEYEDEYETDEDDEDAYDDDAEYYEENEDEYETDEDDEDDEDVDDDNAEYDEEDERNSGEDADDRGIGMRGQFSPRQARRSRPRYTRRRNSAELGAELVSYADEDTYDAITEWESESYLYWPAPGDDGEDYYEEIVQQKMADLAVDYLFAIGRRYGAMPIMSTLQSILNETDDPDTAKRATRALCTYDPVAGLGRAIVSFQNSQIAPDLKAAMAPVLESRGYRDAALELTQFLSNDLDDEEVVSLFEAITVLDVDERVLDALAKLFNDPSTPFRVRDSVVALVEDLCQSLGYGFGFDDEGLLQVWKREE